MRHAFAFPIPIREAVREHVTRAITGLSPTHFEQEPAYTAGLLARLSGVAYEGQDGTVEFRATNVNSIGPDAAEHSFGADFTITADIVKGDIKVSKAILGQAERGGFEDLRSSERERLIGQIRDMRRLTRSPKVPFIREIDGRREPEVASGVRITEGMRTQALPLPDYFVRRLLTTFDGDTRPEFVGAVQHSSL